MNRHAKRERERERELCLSAPIDREKLDCRHRIIYANDDNTSLQSMTSRLVFSATPYG
jgi:hypothetical protein